MNKTTLSQISKPIDGDLLRFNDLFKRSIKSNVGLLDLVTRYILKQKGKKIRPLLVLLSSKLSGGITERSLRGAVLVEILHTATLVHDDVVDNAEKRRGLPSINAIWKNKIGVLLGDYLLAKGLMLSVDSSDYDFLKVITGTVKRMSEGELLQISKTRKLDNDEETYFRIISDKTASLISTCCTVGALSATTDKEKIEALTVYGESLGVAFQIKDDILDYVGTSIIGKPLGGDIKEKKLTLPLIYALKQADANEASRIIKLVKNGKKKKESVKDVIDFVKKFGGIDYAHKIAFEYADKAKTSLENFEDSESKESLISLVDFVINRKK